MGLDELDMMLEKATSERKKPAWLSIYERLDKIEAAVLAGTTHAELADAMSISRSAYYKAKYKAVAYRASQAALSSTKKDADVVVEKAESGTKSLLSDHAENQSDLLENGLPRIAGLSTKKKTLFE